MADIICGVDISADILDARIGRDGIWQQFARTTQGIAQLAAFCKAHQVTLVAMEATDGYERLPFGQLWGKIAALINADPMWAAMDQAFRTIKGVSDRTVARLMADMPELGTLSNKAVAKLCGLAPIARDSGKTVRKRPVRGGRESIRSILYLVAQVVRRHDPDFAAKYERLRKDGKPVKVIRIALARHLVVRLNAKARDVRKALAKAA